MDTQLKIDVSLIIPTYNMADFLSETLESVLQQDYQKLEIIIVNDGSTDNTEDIVKPFLTNPKVQYIYQENRGLPAARNTGIKASRGNLIFFVDADDLLPKDAISVLRKGFEGLSEEYCLVHGEKENFEDGSNKILGTSDFSRISNSKVKMMTLRDNFLLCCMIRKEALFKVGLFDEGMIAGSEDIDVIMRLLKIGKFKPINQVIYKYRIRQNSKARLNSYEKIQNVSNERRFMLARNLKNEELLVKLRVWSVHYLWSAYDYRLCNKKLSYGLFLIAWALYPISLEPLRLLRATYLNKI